MPFCPKCRDEFQDWVQSCPDCHVALVTELPAVYRPEVNPFEPVTILDPPLYKPGNKKCPNCGKDQGWRRSLGPFIWDRLEWQCAQCETVLTYDFARLILLGLFLSLAACGVAVVFAYAIGEVGMFLVIVLLMPAVSWWSNSVKLKFPPDQSRSGQPIEPSEQ